MDRVLRKMIRLHHRRLGLLLFVVLMLAATGSARGQTPAPMQSGDVNWMTNERPPSDVLPSQPGPAYGNLFRRTLPSQESQDQFLDAGPTAIPPVLPTDSSGGPTPEQIRKLMRPTFGGGFEWLAESSGIEFTTFDASVKVPTYPFFGPPPPMLNFGYSLTSLDSPDSLALPDRLHDYQFGASWVRLINEQWTWRMMANMGYASDGNNTSSDAWQFRGGFFAAYQPSPEWSWVFGALALGRNDLPVVPALGVTYRPNDAVSVDLLMPRPRVTILLADNGDRQQWGYFGAVLSGGTWAIQRRALDDQLTYRDWRVVLGWESTPRRPPGMPFVRGRKLTIEAGYVFGREIEFESGAASIPLDETVLLRAVFSF